MNLYLLLPLSSCLACCMLLVAVLARDSTRAASRLAAGVAACGAWWALCEVMWSAAHEREAAHWLICLSSLGWMTIGPAILHLVIELTGHPLRDRRWLRPALYAPPALLALADLTTSWVHPEVVRSSWGWNFEVGPLFPAGLALAAGTVTTGLVMAFKNIRNFGSPADQRQTKWLLVGVLMPLLVATFTDGVMPILGHHFPRLGAASITLLVASIWWTFHRYGYSLLAPGNYGTEILATLREGVALIRLDGRIHSTNPGMGQLLGAEPADLEGYAMADLIDAPLFDVMEEINELTCNLTPRADSPVPVSICTSLLRDKLSNPIGLVLVARDLRELESLRSHLITSGRLASVGQLAAGIAHEINNPAAYVRANLGTLAGIVDSLASKLPADDPRTRVDLTDSRELIEESLEGVDRIAAIVRDVKGFSHAGEDTPESVELRPLLESVLRVAAPQLRHSAKIVRDYGDALSVRGAPQELKQVFLNLIINASQAIAAGEIIELVTRACGDCVAIEVRDEGCGIPADQIERVFDPFFTTKRVGEGTGLGLSISYQIVQRNGGNLSVESKPGRGTCFRVELPAAESSPI